MLKDFVSFKGFKRIPNTGNQYEVSCTAQLRETISKKPIELVCAENGEPSVPSTIPEWFAGKSIALIMAITFRNTVLPPNMWDQLELIYKDGDCTNYRLTNTIWKCPEGKLTHYLVPGFCYIPGYSRYMISLSGAVMSVQKGELLSPYMDANGYLMYGVQPDVGPRTIVGMHRLLALTYKPYGGGVDRLDVNHIDTIKDNNALLNLEWATRSRNNYHAHENGLSNSKAVLVRNVATNEVSRFYSIEECARYLQLEGETVRQRIIHGGSLGKVYSGLYQFKYEDDPAPWIIHDAIEEYTHAKLTRRLRATSIKTDIAIEFNTIAEAASFFGVKGPSIYYQLSKNTTGIVFKDHLLEYMS